VMMSNYVQPAAMAHANYICYICDPSLDSNPTNYRTGPRLIEHMKSKHQFFLTSRIEEARGAEFIGSFTVWVDYSDEGKVIERLCCPSCNFSTEISNDQHQDLYKHYFSQGHVQKAPVNALRPRPHAQAASPLPAPLMSVYDLTDEEVIEESKQRGWYWPDNESERSREIWLDYARHGNPNFVRRRPYHGLWVAEQSIANNYPDNDIGAYVMDQDYIDKDDMDEDCMEQDYMEQGDTNL
ncbi:hypothetical protein MBANPS3_011979, partial [Mucor bainieri]